MVPQGQGHPPDSAPVGGSSWRTVRRGLGGRQCWGREDPVGETSGRGWEPIDPGQFMDVVSELAAAEAWVIDGNYRFGSWSATVRSGSGPTPSCGSILPGGS